MGVGGMLAATPTAASAATPRAQVEIAGELLLRIVINGRAREVFATFRRAPDGSLLATPHELQIAGFKSGIGQTNAEGFISLDSLHGMTWHYEEATQTVLFKVPDAMLMPTVVDIAAGMPPTDLAQVRSDYGLLANYTVYGVSQGEWSNWSLRGSTGTLSGTAEARIFTPFGTVSSTVLARGSSFDGYLDGGRGVVRLDTAWRYVDPTKVLTYQVGDGISGSLPWASSYRFGGLQLSRNFATRPDLVTTPMPFLGGSASMPSSLDLYLNNIQIFSGQVPAGPFSVAGLPFLGSGGDVRVVMRDELGREVVTQRSFYFAPDALRQGLLDFSAEVGFPRLAYGYRSDLYDPNLAGSASARYGLVDWLTLEGHGEATRGLLNGGAGAITSLGLLGSVRVAGAASRYSADGPAETGGKTSVLYQVSHRGYALNLGIDRLFGSYTDVGLAVDRRYHNAIPISARAREVLRGGVSLPMIIDPSSISFNATRIRGSDPGDDSTIYSVSWSRAFRGISVYANAYTGAMGAAGMSRRRSAGVFGGFTMPLGHDLVASSGVSHSRDGTSVTSTLSRNARLSDGQIGWSLRDQSVVSGSNGGFGNGTRGATANYRSSIGFVTASAEQSGSASRVSGSIDGSVVIAGGDVFFGNRIDDAFAVVKAGGPNLPVSLNGTRVATTNGNGRAIVPYLQSYRPNKIMLDPKDLPFDLQPEETAVFVVPAERFGVVVDFGVRKVNGASVSFTGPDGKVLPVGSEIRFDGSDQVFVSGYDGRSYFTELMAENAVTVTLPEAKGTCRASFKYQPLPGQQPEIGPVRCH